MTERVLGVRERVEDADTADTLLQRRTAQLRAAALGEGAPQLDGLGSCDAVYLVKAWRGVASRVWRQGFYHEAAGLDVSVTGVCAYFSALLAAVEPVPWLTWLLPGEWSIEQAEFCFHAPFSGVDLRVRLRVPGTVQEWVVSAGSERMGATAELWAEVRYASWLRSVALARPCCSALPRDGSCFELPPRAQQLPLSLRRLPPAAVPEAELLQLAAKFSAAAGVAPVVAEGLGESQCASTAWLALRAHFLDSSRFLAGRDFFAGLARHNHLAYVHAAEFEALLGNSEESTQLLLKAKLLCQSRPDGTAEVLAGVAGNRLREGNEVAALELLEEALGLEQGNARIWFAYSHALALGGHFERSLVALNSAPVVEADVSSEPEDRCTEVSATAPELMSGETEIFIRECAEETQGLPASRLEGLEQDAYQVLVAILNAVGWDELLVIRGDVFLTESASAADVGEAIQSAQAKLDDLELDEKVELMLEAVESPANDSIRLGPSLDFPTADETVGADACCSCEGEAAAPCYCSAYLEFLFQALYDDLATFSSAFGEEDDAGDEAERTTAEWVQLGHAACRLQAFVEAEVAFRHAVEQGEGSYLGWAGLLKLYVDADCVPEAVLCVEQMLLMLEVEAQRARQGGPCPDDDAVGLRQGGAADALPPRLSCALRQLIASNGLAALRSCELSETMVRVVLDLYSAAS